MYIYICTCIYLTIYGCARDPALGQTLERSGDASGGLSLPPVTAKRKKTESTCNISAHLRFMLKSVHNTC